MNDFGQIAFRAGLTDTSGGASDDGGIFLWNDQSGLHELFRKADPLFGSSIVQLSSPALNNAGQIAFGFELADGRKGIAIWSIPEPAALSLFFIGALIQIGLLRQQRHS